MAPTAQPLNTVTALSTATKSYSDDADKTPTPLQRPPTTKPSGGLKDISSPHELTSFVETLLEQLDSKFDEMSSQILERMSQMSTRVDALEASLQDIINGDISVPHSPAPVLGTPGIRRSDSGLT